MAKSKKQKNIAWIKLPVNLMDDERIAELVDQKGMAGLGAYIAIICGMYRRSCRCLTKTQLKALKFPGVTQKTIQAVVNEFGLFRKDGMGHIYSIIDFLGFEDEISDNDSDRVLNSLGFESSSLPTPARVYIKDEDKDKDHHIDDADDKCEVDYIGMIPQQSEWTDVAVMKSGFGELIKRNWVVALDLFRNHAIVNCTISKIRSLEDAKRYFLYYVTNPTSGGMFRNELEEHERAHQQDNPFGYEDADSRLGNRKYHGIPLPNDAPPRPDERSEWDFSINKWINI